MELTDEYSLLCAFRRYPADKKSKQGKLRILYEGNPMSMICEQAGGLATTGRMRVLDVIPKSIHERTPIFLGCKRDVEIILRLHAEEDAKEAVR